MTSPAPKKLARVLAILMAGASLLLIAILVAGVILDSYRRYPEPVEGVAWMLFHAAGMAWPLVVLLGCALAAALLLATRPRFRTRWLWPGCVLAGGALLTAWSMGVRMPVTRTGVFAGRYVHHPVCCRDLDLFLPDDSLPRGAQIGLVAHQRQGTPVMAAVRVPESGWHGNHPDQWKIDYSDSHGATYFCLRVRGRLTGPGQYGWPPAFQYRLRVDSVVSVRPEPKRADCSTP